ncbi:MAG TPA: MBL fold metallo-hydrolase [Candidatus Dormibacteraeota bacterium]|nr:MBL fold metallo-hydrolase [Candidatus Dormibacteraeota bacterium]
MDLTVLGCRGGVPGEEASSGYLVTHHATALLLDCGPGVFGRLVASGLRDRLSGVVLTHLHYDHCADALVLARALAVKAAAGSEEGAPSEVGRLASVPALLVPEGGDELLQAMAQLFPVPVLPAYQRCFEIGLGLATMVDGERVDIGDLQIQAFRLRHAIPNNGLRITAGGVSLAYTGDTGPCDEVIALARGVDLLLCEATFDRSGVHPEHGHLSAQEAGVIAREAEVGALVLTHFLEGSPSWRLRQVELARREFSGPIVAATAGMTIPLSFGAALPSATRTAPLGSIQP